MKGIDSKWGAAQQRDSVPASQGFDGQLRCASLADLIQLQCGNRVHAGVSVRSEGRHGALYFEEGQIVHAATGDLVGEAAVYEMLEWTGGTFGQSSAPWPTELTVTAGWQQLLLTAAQRRDEMQPGFPATSTSRLKAVREPTSELDSLPPPAWQERTSTVGQERTSTVGQERTSTVGQEGSLFAVAQAPPWQQRWHKPILALTCAMLALPVLYLVYRMAAAGGAAPVTVEMAPPAERVTTSVREPSAPIPPASRTLSPPGPAPAPAVPALEAAPHNPAPAAANPDDAVNSAASAATDNGALPPAVRRRVLPRKSAPAPAPGPRARAADPPPVPKATENPNRIWDHDSPLPP